MFRFLRATASQPSAERMLRFKGIPGEESELELARQFSTILLIDALVGQWDRFSGGNVQMIQAEAGRVQFVAYDNGDGAHAA